MRITSIAITIGRTINLGNYENLRIEAGMTAEIAEGDQIAEVRAALINECRQSLIAQWQAYKQEKKP